MEAHASKVRRTYIAGAGVSGLLLAGAAIVFISLVGLVSFATWPEADDQLAPLSSALESVLPAEPDGGAVTLSPPEVTPGAPAAGAAAASSTGQGAPTSGTVGNGGGNAKKAGGRADGKGTGHGNANGQSKGHGKGHGKGHSKGKGNSVPPVAATPVTSPPGHVNSRSATSGNGSPGNSGESSHGRSVVPKPEKVKGPKGPKSGSNGNGRANGHAKHGR